MDKIETAEQATTLLDSFKDLIEQYSEEAVNAYIAIVGSDYATPEEFEESYQGEYSSDEDFARDMAENLGETKNTYWPHYCIDWEFAARELMMDYSEENGHYFRNI